jgi:hypothetical protein
MNKSILTLIACVFVTSAQGQEILLDSYQNVGVRSTGMGGAYLALSDDVSGLYHNPAGLARMRLPEVYSSFVHSTLQNQSEFLGSNATDDITSSRLGGVGAAYPFPVYQGSLVLAASYAKRANFDQGLRIAGYDNEVQFDKSGFSRDRGSLGDFSFGGAIDLAMGLSFGLTGFVWEGENSFEQALTLTDTRSAHVDTVSLFQRFESLDTYKAVGARAGLLYVHPSGSRFGVTVRPPVRVEISSQLEDEFVDEYEDGVEVYPPESFGDEYSYELPWEFGVGFAWTGQGLTATGDVVYSDTRRTRYEGGSVNVSSNVDDFKTQYRARPRVHLGLEYALHNQPLRFRTGYFRNPVTYVGGDGLPAIDVKEERQGITFGASAEAQKALVLDVALVLNRYRQREGRREDNVRTTRLFASLSYRFLN